MKLAGLLACCDSILRSSQAAKVRQHRLRFRLSFVTQSGKRVSLGQSQLWQNPKFSLSIAPAGFVVAIAWFNRIHILISRSLESSQFESTKAIALMLFAVCL